MGRNPEENIYIEVPFALDSEVLESLKNEVIQASPLKKKRLDLGPHIAKLLKDRSNAQHHTEEEDSTWLSPYIQAMRIVMKPMIEDAVRDALQGLSLSMLAPKVEQAAPSDIEVIEQESKALAEAWGEDDWGDES